MRKGVKQIIIFIKNYSYKNYDLLVDKTNYNQYEPVSQLPVDYICTLNYEFKFKLHKYKNGKYYSCSNDMFIIYNSNIITPNW